MIDIEKLDFCKEKEVRKIIENKEKYVFVDDGITEVIIKKEDIPDYIVYVNREFGSTDLKIINPQKDYETIITTYGEFLDKCNSEIRKEIINRLVKLQTNEIDYNRVKAIDEDMWDSIVSEFEKDDEEELE